jgi:glycosyltransferase involved in cell wall biosynthesis
VYNGIDWSDYGTVNLTKKRAGYHFLGEAAWKVKNLKGAMTVTKALPGEYLEVLGGYRFNFKMGMRFTFSPKIHFKGMVDDVQKKQVIEQSKGLLFPVTWHEPFGLAVTESLYFGSPVFGTPYGSLPELITSDVGFLTNNATTLINYLKDNPVYSPRICHEYACDLFNSKIMAEAYLKKYETVLNGQPLNTNAPQAMGNSRDLLWQQYTTIN